MAKRSSPVPWIPSVNKSREISLDLDVPPVPRGWERCLDLKSGLLYLKEMEQTGTGRQFNQKKTNSPKVFDIFKPRKKSFTVTGLELKGSRKNHFHCDPQNFPSKIISQETVISKSSQQNVKRQKLDLSIDEKDGLSLQLSLSLPSCDSYSVLKPQPNLQNGDKIAVQNRLDVRPTVSLMDQSFSNSCQNSILELDSLSRCSSSASSFSDAVEIGNELTRSAAEIESNKSKTSEAVHNELEISSRALRRMMAAGCPHCLMFVLLVKDNPRCPKCGSSILLNVPAPQ